MGLYTVLNEKVVLDPPYLHQIMISPQDEKEKKKIPFLDEKILI